MIVQPISLAMGVLAVFGLMPQVMEGRSAWPLWESYAARFIDASGRVVDFDADSRTTSEGQSYALFFALVANDRERFNSILTWTEKNLTRGLDVQLPAWLWGKGADQTWGIRDENSASDSDVWIAYSLTQAGRLWDDAHLLTLGTAMAERIARTEVVDIPKLGPMLIPGPVGFHPSPNVYQLNPSYLPVQILLGLSQVSPQGPWRMIAQKTPQVIRGSSLNGFALDWIAYDVESGFSTKPVPTDPVTASYDAIRVYLWTGMLSSSHLQRELLAALPGMVNQIRKAGIPPAIVQTDGTIKDSNGGPGFSAATIPYLLALHEVDLAKAQSGRLQSFWDVESGLYGKPARYYDQNLALFSLGWGSKRFSFDSNGNLRVPWRQ